jgi:hypothetical protein
MPARMTRSAPQSPFELPEVRAVVRANCLARTPEKRKNSRRFGVHLENLGLEMQLGRTQAEATQRLLADAC